jgi:hypothetical protein
VSTFSRLFILRNIESRQISICDFSVVGDSSDSPGISVLVFVRQDVSPVRRVLL